jgi:hypothetical protein
MNAGNSLTVRFANPTTDVRMIQLWANNNAAGIFRIRSPKLHDNVQGIRYRIQATDPIPVLADGSWQKLVPQDTLIAEISGSAVGGQIECGAFLVWYADLPGSAARLANWADIVSRIVNILTVEVAVTPGSAGGYSGQVAINSTFDLLQANTDYALLGGTVDTRCSIVRVQGPDTGNLGVGFPGITADRMITAEWFKDLNLMLNIPTIPVINSANKAGTLLDIMQNQAGSAVNVNLVMAQLAPK